MKSIQGVIRNYNSGLAIAKSSQDLDEVQNTIDAIKYVDTLNKMKCFAVAILMPGDLMFIRPGDLHCFLTCHELGVKKFGSIAAGTVIYTDEEKHNHLCIQ